MKAIKGFILFGLLGGMVSSCFDAPEFDVVPEITFEKVEFKESPSSINDSLIIYINFKDGDGDLGLDPASAEDSEYPYNNAFYYLATGPGQLDSVSTSVTYISDPPYDAFIVLRSIDHDITGPLVIDKTRENPEFDFLPPYFEASCLNYSLTQILVPAYFKAVDETYNITDTLYQDRSTREIVKEVEPLRTYDTAFVVEEPLYYKRNLNHYNIDVEFLILEDGDFVPFDWYENFCIDFNGRFPLLGKGERPLEGTIRYGMTNPTFLAVFSVKTLKLRVKIRDRANRTSNVVDSPPFTLSSI